MTLNKAIWLAIDAQANGEPVPVDVMFVLNEHGIQPHDL